MAQYGLKTETTTHIAGMQVVPNGGGGNTEPFYMNVRNVVIWSKIEGGEEYIVVDKNTPEFTYEGTLTYIAYEIKDDGLLFDESANEVITIHAVHEIPDDVANGTDFRHEDDENYGFLFILFSRIPIPPVVS